MEIIVMEVIAIIDFVFDLCSFDLPQRPETQCAEP